MLYKEDKVKKFFLILLIGSLTTSCGIEGLLNEAEIKKESGKSSDAIELYTRAIKQDDNSVDAYEGRADIYSDLKIRDKAASDYIKAAINAEFYLKDKKKIG